MPTWSRSYVPAESVEEQWDMAGLEKALEREFGSSTSPLPRLARAGPTSIDERHRCDAVIVEAAERRLRSKKRRGRRREFMRQFERMIMLQQLDSHWREHLAALDYLRQGIHLRGYAQKNPKQEYKREAFELFGAMLERVKHDTISDPAEDPDAPARGRAGGRARGAGSEQRCSSSTQRRRRWSRRRRARAGAPAARRGRSAGCRTPKLRSTRRDLRARATEGRPQRAVPMRLG